MQAEDSNIPAEACGQVDCESSSPLQVLCLCRLWSFSKRQLVLDKQLADDPLCVSLHPTGFMMLIGCVDRLRLYFVVRSVHGAVCCRPAG